MFKFLKSKKGFTLVELMIVVVIMAILVAVAVPIFSAVTKNARIKTCAGNRREIVSQLNNYIMGSVDGQQHNENMSFTIESDGSKGAIKGTPSTITSTTIGNLFQELPYCPSGKTNAKVDYSVNVTNTQGQNGAADTAKVVVTCPIHTNATGAALEDEATLPSSN